MVSFASSAAATNGRSFGTRWPEDTVQRARRGAEIASRPYLCLLNSDTLVTPWCWYTVKEAFEGDSAIGVAGPSTSESSNEQTVEMAAHCWFYWHDSPICSFAELLTAAYPNPAICDLPWASGFAFFIRRDLWQRLNGFDEHLADYGNELELCKRVRNIRLSGGVGAVRSSYIHHILETKVM